jgi:hypothetical protein
MNALDTLSTKVRHTFAQTLRDPAWGKPQLMSKVLAEVSALFDMPHKPVSRKPLGNILAAFRETRSLPTFIDLKYACLGITQSFGLEGWRLIEDPALFRVLLHKVASLRQNPGANPPQPDGKRMLRRFVKCYQALLSGYFTYNIHQEGTPEQGRNNWKLLRAFLHDHLEAALQSEPMSRWLNALGRHRNLLGENIYESYGEGMGQADYDDLKSACECLLIPRDSWVWEMTVLVRVKALCAHEDDSFMSHLDQCLALLTRTSGIVLSPIMKKQCMALLACRYAACASPPEHPSLLDAAVRFIGNPWANRAAWDAFVKDEPAREMMGSWLKRRLIRDFFGMLWDGGLADAKRLRSWLHVEPRIDDLWVALGPHAFNHAGARHRELRDMAGERVLELEHGDRPEINALIVRIDDYVFVELSASGHTCMVFRSSSLPFDLSRKWVYVGSKTSDQQQLFLQGQVLQQNIISAE